MNSKSEKQQLSTPPYCKDHQFRHIKRLKSCSEPYDMTVDLMQSLIDNSFFRMTLLCHHGSWNTSYYSINKKMIKEYLTEAEIKDLTNAALPEKPSENSTEYAINRYKETIARKEYMALYKADRAYSSVKILGYGDVNWDNVKKIYQYAYLNKEHIDFEIETGNDRINSADHIPERSANMSFTYTNLSFGRSLTDEYYNFIINLFSTDISIDDNTKGNDKFRFSLDLYDGEKTITFDLVSDLDSTTGINILHNIIFSEFPQLKGPVDPEILKKYRYICLCH